MGFQFIKGIFDLPSLMIERGRFLGRRLIGSRARFCKESQALLGNGAVLKIAVISNQEQLLFPECSCGGRGFSIYGAVDLPEFLSKPIELNSDHAPTEMLLAYERYAASLIFLSGRIHENELLPRFHACS